MRIKDIAKTEKVPYKANPLAYNLHIVFIVPHFPWPKYLLHGYDRQSIQSQSPIVARIQVACINRTVTAQVDLFQLFIQLPIKTFRGLTTNKSARIFGTRISAQASLALASSALASAAATTAAECVTHSDTWRTKHGCQPQDLLAGRHPPN